MLRRFLTLLCACMLLCCAAAVPSTILGTRPCGSGGFPRDLLSLLTAYLLTCLLHLSLRLALQQLPGPHGAQGGADLPGLTLHSSSISPHRVCVRPAGLHGMIQRASLTNMQPSSLPARLALPS